jgi:hypothetical protein
MQALFNLRTIIVSSKCGTLYVKMYACLDTVFSPILNVNCSVLGVSRVVCVMLFKICSFEWIKNLYYQRDYLCVTLINKFAEYHDSLHNRMKNLIKDLFNKIKPDPSHKLHTLA